MLPNATLEQKIATGFNRNHRHNARRRHCSRRVPGRIRSRSRRAPPQPSGWVSRLGCARCHDHKYDPISQKEFYQVFAYFNNVPEKGLIPKVRQYRADDSRSQRESSSRSCANLERTLEAAAQAKFAGFEPELAAAQRRWEQVARSIPTAGLVDRRGAGSAAMRSRETPALTSQRERRPTHSSSTWREGRPGVRSTGRIGRAASFDGKRFLDAGDTAALPRTEVYASPPGSYPTAAHGAIITRTPDISETRGPARLIQGYGLFLKAANSSSV